MVQRVTPHPCNGQHPRLLITFLHQVVIEEPATVVVRTGTTHPEEQAPESYVTVCRVKVLGEASSRADCLVRWGRGGVAARRWVWATWVKQPDDRQSLATRSCGLYAARHGPQGSHGGHVHPRRACPLARHPDQADAISAMLCRTDRDGGLRREGSRRHRCAAGPGPLPAIVSGFGSPRRPIIQPTPATHRQRRPRRGVTRRSCRGGVTPVRAMTGVCDCRLQGSWHLASWILARGGSRVALAVAAAKRRRRRGSRSTPLARASGLMAARFTVLPSLALAGGQAMPLSNWMPRRFGRLRPDALPPTRATSHVPPPPGRYATDC